MEIRRNISIQLEDFQEGLRLPLLLGSDVRARGVNGFFIMEKKFNQKSEGPTQRRLFVFISWNYWAKMIL